MKLTFKNIFSLIAILFIALTFSSYIPVHPGYIFSSLLVLALFMRVPKGILGDFLTPELDLGEGVDKLSAEQVAAVNKLAAAKIEEAKAGAVDISSATKFLENAGGKVFLAEKQFHDEVHNTLNTVMTTRIDNPNELQKTVMKFKSDLIGEVLSPVDQQIKSLSGIEKNEDEKTKDYASRVFTEVSKSGKGNEGELNALRGKLDQANAQVKKLEGTVLELNQAQQVQERNQLVSQGIPGNLAYSAEERKIVMPGIMAQVNQQFKFEKDDSGKWFATDNTTGNPVLDQQGNKRAVNDVVNDFIINLPGIKLGDTPPGGAQVPGGQGGQGGGGNNEEQEKKWKEELNKKGLIGHEREAMLMRKNLGLPISQRALEQWPELKS
jgi:hypothetical protein